MSVGTNCATSKLRPPTDIPKSRLYRTTSVVDDPALEKEKCFSGRAVGSIAARAQAWERCPATGYVTIGSVRYGVRFSSTSPSREVVPSRGAATKLPADSNCCCGVVHLAWPRAGAPTSRIPLPPRANNNSETSVYRSTLDVSRPSLPGHDVMKGAPPTPTSLRRRILVKFGNSPSVTDGETSRLIPPADSREDLPSASAASQVQNTLEKLQKFRFGGASSSDDKNVKKRSGDKTEKLRELTDLLRGRPDKKKPPTNPTGKTTKSSGLRSFFGSTTSLTGPPKEAVSSHKRAASVTSVATGGGNHGQKPTQSFEESFPNTVKEEDQEELAAVTSQRPFTARSASFSQVDFNSSDGKYSWKRGGLTKVDQTVSKAMTFPRKTHVDAATSVSPPPEPVGEEQTGSTPSVDSAVGSDEGLGLGFSSQLPVSSEQHKLLGSRSLTYPLSTKKNISPETTSFLSIDGHGLKSLHLSRELTNVKEEVSADLGPSGVGFNLSHLERNKSLESKLSMAETPRDPSSSINLQTSHNREMLLPLENLGKEIDELLVQEKEMPNSPEIFITTWPKTDTQDYETAVMPETVHSTLKHCDIHNFDEVCCSENLKNSLNNNDAERNLNSPQRWSGGTDSSLSTKGCGSEPMSPEDLVPKPVWPKVSKSKLPCQSSEEKEDDMRPSPKRSSTSNNDSPSDGESDQADRCPSTPRRNCSPSPIFSTLFDLSDNETRSGKKATHPPRRYSKRPLRGPYGQMLEAEMKKPETRQKSKKQDDLKFLEEYLPLSLSSSVSSDKQSAECRLTSPRLRANTARSMDDSHLRTNYGTNPRTSPKRKVSANIPYSAPNPSTGKDELVVSHQRTTSSPSQLGTYSPYCETSHSPTTGQKQAPTQELLAELLKGSSERHCLHEDERSQVVNELVETESSYVESLQNIVKKYLNPLKSAENEDLIDAAVVDEIFYQIPEILAHHEMFLDELKQRLGCWSASQVVGDVILDVFTKQSVIETYMSYIGNCKRAKEVLDTTQLQKPLFAKFLTNAARGHKGKLILDDLIIKPVQRIPRYELLIQRILKCTDSNHPDHSLLLAAHREVHDLAVRINTTRTESLQQQQTLRDLETLIEGLADLPSCDRVFLRSDTVTMVSGQGTRKERALFLFSDLLVVTSIKRRTGPIKKPVSTTCSGLLADTPDTNKYKLHRRLTLDDLEIVKTKDEKVRSILREVERLTEDAATLTHIAELANTLHTSHAALDDTVRDMLSSVNRQLQERQTGDAQLACLEVNLSTQNEGESLSILFGTTEKRTSWEDAFLEAKQKLALSSEHRSLPEFVAPVPIRKTRAGLQFTCASPTLSVNSSNVKDVWVCNSDGYVGQVCVLSLQPKPNVISCNGVCNARILCIASVPAATSCDSESNRTSGSSDVKVSLGGIVGDAEDAPSDMEADSSSSSSPSDEEEVPDGDIEMRRSKSEPLSGDVSSDDADSVQPSMWLGTEDGNIHVYNCSDNIRVKKNKVKIQHGSSVQCIVYYDKRVFVALANGDVIVYSRDRSGGWNTPEPDSVVVGTAAASVTKMIPVSGKMWCACHNMIRILNIVSLQVEKSFPASPDCSRMVSGIAVVNLGVWIALHNSAVLRLFHATSYECLSDVNVAPAVTKMLAGCDDIIRQHKAACLRVTSLLAIKDLLWVGTSAGVVLTMPLPHVTPSTTKLNNLPNVIGVPQGHTGHVRFLTSVDITLPGEQPPPRLSRHRHSLKNKPDPQTVGKVLVISGGDGYEDFRNSSVSEVAGREDATNHLLLWQI